MITEYDNTLAFIKNYEEFANSINNNNPQWLTQLRQEGLSRFTEVGIPTTKDEEWKYTNIAAIVQQKYNISESTSFNSFELFDKIVDPKETNIVFVNGNYSSELSSINNADQGVSISTLQEAIDNKAFDIEELLKKYDTKDETAFVALNRSLTANGIVINVDKKVISENLIHIIHVATEDDTISFPRTLIVLGEASQASVLETHFSSSDDSIYLTNALTDIFVDENAVLNYCKAQKESTKAYHIGNTRIWQERSSTVNGSSIMTGAAITRNNLDMVLNGEGIDSTLNGLYLLHGNQHADNHTSVDHRMPNCTSNQLYKGILDGASRAVFNGKIFVRSIAQKTNSYQLNKNLLLGQDCRVDTKPQLEIFADDVKCTHGATIGQLNEDEIFYLQSRAVAKKDAVKMLSVGYVDDLIDTITNESTKSKLHSLLEPSFAKL